MLRILANCPLAFLFTLITYYSEKLAQQLRQFIGWIGMQLRTHNKAADHCPQFLDRYLQRVTSNAHIPCGHRGIRFAISLMSFLLVFKGVIRGRVP